MNYYEHHLGDYMKDTAHLSALEDGIYRRLLDAYYIREQALPADMIACQKLARARSKSEREAVVYVVEGFFELRADGYHKDRCDKEIAKYLDKQAKAKASANARWNKDKAACDGNANASECDGQDGMRSDMRTHSEGSAPRARPQSPVNIKPSISPSSVPSTPDPAPNPTGPALISKAFREHGVQSNPSDPRIIALADRGLGYDQALAAAGEARRSKPDESISPGYVVKILERWADDADKSRGGPKLNGTPRPQTIHEQRAAVIAGLCTPSAAALPPPQEDFLDVESHRIA